MFAGRAPRLPHGLTASASLRGRPAAQPGPETLGVGFRPGRAPGAARAVPAEGRASVLRPGWGIRTAADGRADARCVCVSRGCLLSGGFLGHTTRAHLTLKVIASCSCCGRVPGHARQRRVSPARDSVVPAFVGLASLTGGALRGGNSRARSSRGRRPLLPLPLLRLRPLGRLSGSFSNGCFCRFGELSLYARKVLFEFVGGQCSLHVCSASLSADWGLLQIK